MPGIHCIYKRHLPLSSFSESQHHRRSRLSASERTQPSITRCRSVKPATASCSLQKPTGLFAYRSRGLETFAFFPRQILRTPRFCQRRKSLHLLSKFSPPEATRLQQSMPLLSPQGKHYRLLYRSAEWTVRTSWPARFQLRWHLRLRLRNVSKLPFLSACT